MATLEVHVDGHAADLAPDTEENWDDDFEFGAGSGSGSGRANPRTPPRNRRQGERAYAQMSIGSRAETEDWDAEVDGEFSPVKLNEPERDLRTPTKPPGTVVPLPLPLAVTVNVGHETENWDDDFEYSRNSPMKPGASAYPMADSSSTPAAKTYRPQPSSPLSPLPPASPSRSPSTSTSPMNKHLSSLRKDGRPDADAWDDEFDRELDADFALKNPHANDEEDRTVTARTRRAALARAAAQHAPPLPTSLPPPTPALPPTFSNSASGAVFLAPHSSTDPSSVVEPFPSPSLSSPASSVFSVPGTVRTMHSASTAPLMSPSTVGSFGYPSASARVFSLLPPSPQLHRERERKERERRRLRKRSRPGDRERMREREGVFELVDVANGAGSPGSPSRGSKRYGRRSLGANIDEQTHSRRSFDSARAFSEEEDIGEGPEDVNADGDVEADNGEGAHSASGHSSDARHRPVIGPPRTSSALPDSYGGVGLVPLTPGKQTLLGRIGSVKRWVGIGSGSGAATSSGSGVSGGIVGKLQRRRGMSTGADGGYGYGDARLTSPDHQRTPRPQSSLSSFGNYNNYSTQSHLHPNRAHSEDTPAASNVTPGSSGWFFRASSRASSNTAENNTSPSPTGPARRGFRTPSTPGTPSGRARAATASNATPSPGPAPASPDGNARRPGKLTRTRSGDRSRSGSRSRIQAGGRTPRRSVGSSAGVDGQTEGHATSAVDSGRGGDGADSPHGPPLARRPSAGRRVYPYRPASRGGVRASMDFSASRASLGMTMSILEAEERGATDQTPPHVHAGRGRGYSVGSGTPGESGGRTLGAGPEVSPPSPSAARLGKRKSLGFMQLRRAMGGGGTAEDSVDGTASGVEKSGGGRYGGLGIGRALGLKSGMDHAKDKDGERGEDAGEYERSRRKSLSRLLRRDDSAARQGGAPKTPIKESFNTSKLPNQEPEKVQEGARGFMGSVRRISLVGRHKRTKSGGVLIDRSTPVPPTPPSPSASTGFFSSARRPSGNATNHAHTSLGPGAGKQSGPYALPALPTSESQISLSLRHATASTGHLPLPSSILTTKKTGSGRRIVSTASSRSQGSSVLPPSTSSASSDGRRSVASSRNPSGTLAQAKDEGTDIDKDADNENLHKTPRQPHRPAPARRPSSSSRSRRSRTSEEHLVLANVGRASLDFEAKMRQSLDQDRVPVPPLPSSSPTSLSLLPPIELQPPSPPQTLGPAGAGIKTRSPVAEDNQKLEGALNLPPQSTVSLSPTASSSSLFYTPKSSPRATLGVEGSPASVNANVKNRLSPGKSPGTQQSASLGRVGAATAAAATVEGGSGNTDAGEGDTGDHAKARVPRRNSLGDLKIPARISQAQVNIKRDLGMVREFASSVEQLKEMQRTYQMLVGQVQQIFESHVHAYSARPSTSVAPSSDIPAAEVIPPPRTTSAATAGGFFANLKPKTRARSNTNPNPAPPSSLTPASASSSASTSVAASASASTQDVTTAQIAYKEMAALFWTINSKYRIPWECADLLIELGGGSGGDDDTTSPPPSTSISVPFVQQAQAAVFDIPSTSVGKKMGRERAITLAGNQTTPIKKPYIVQPESPAKGAEESTSSVTAKSDQTPIQSVAGPPPASPPASNNMSWRSSTGRHDLSQRQLVLLREMLNNSNAAAAASASGSSGQLESGLRSASAPSASANASTGSDIPPQARDVSLQAPYVDRDWRWGDARNSTITLPSEESIQQRRQQIQREYEQDRQRGQPSHSQQQPAADPERKRRRGIGMAGIRDMLRALKRGAAEGTVSPLGGEGATGMRAAALSTASLSTQSSKGSKLHRYPHPRVPPMTGDSGRRRAKTSATMDSTGTGTVRASRDDATAATSPLSTFVPPRTSPRRPSLASIFRLGNSSKQRAPSMSTDDFSGSAVQDQLRQRAQGRGQSSSGPDGEGSSTSEEDWDRMDSASDLDGLGRGDGVDHLATVRGGNNSLRKARQRTNPYLQDASFDPPQHLQTLPLPMTSPTTSGRPHAIISKRSFNISSSSLRPLPDGSVTASPPGTGQRFIRLSNVTEAADEANSPTKPHQNSALSAHEDAHNPRLSANVGSPASARSQAPTIAGSVRSMPPPQFTSSVSVPLLKEGKLAMTPENIKPLLENAKEVLAKLQECIVEMQALVTQSSTGT